MNYITISWHRLQSDAEKVADSIIEDKKTYDVIVAIARGGLTSAHMLSDFLSLPVTSFTATSYKGTLKSAKSRITFDIGENIKDKRVLLVDELSDTGDTFMMALEHLQHLGCTAVSTAALYIKPHTAYKPDYYVDTLDGWIIFPYEVKETIESLVKDWNTHGMSSEECRQKLRALSFSDEHIIKYMGI